MIIRAIRPDTVENARFSIGLEHGKTLLKLSVTSKDMTGLLAGVNSYSRLIKTAIDAMDVE